MPKLYLPVPELDKAIVRPVMLDIIKQVRDITNMPKDVNVVFLSDAHATAHSGSRVDEQIDNNTRISGSNRLLFEVAEQYNPDNIGTMAIAQSEQIPIFIDNKLGVVLRPIYASKVFDISIRYRDHSKTRVKAWRDEIYMRVNQMRDINLHTAKYHYSIPVAFGALVKEIYKLRESVAGYGDTFDEYLSGCIDKRVTEVTNLTGDYPILAIAEHQTRIQGLFDFTDAPEKEQEDGSINKWVSSFTYKVTIDIPVGVHIQYPVMVHNQLLDEKYIPKPAYDENKSDMAFARSLKSIHRFEAQRIADNSRPMGKVIHEPEYDDWWPDNQMPDSAFVFSALCELIPEDPRLIVNLRELGSYCIDPDILKFFAEVEYPYLTKPFQSMYHVSLYRDKFLSTDRLLKVDHNLDFKSSEDLDIRRNHRFVLSMLTRVDGVNPAALKRMKRYPNVLLKTLKAIRATQGDLARISPNLDITKYGKDLPRVGPSKNFVYDHNVRMRTVLSSYVMARNVNEGHTGRLTDYDTNKAQLLPIHQRVDN